MQKTLPLVDFLKTFPSKDTARPHQIDALEKIASIFSKGKKFVIACLPTGSGKSHIAASVARSATKIDDNRRNLIESYSIYKKTQDGVYYYEDDFLLGDSFGSFILTVTKSLQDQYEKLFPEVVLGKGKGNYSCSVNPNLTVEYAPCLYDAKLKQKCFSEKRCPYYEARARAYTSIDPVLNYRAFMSLPKFLRKREIYICDEASDIESELVSQYSLTIHYSQLSSEGIDYKKLTNDDHREAGIWIQNIHLKAKNELDSLKNKISNIAKNDIQKMVKNKEMQRLGKLTNMVNSLEGVIDRWDECEYLVEFRDAEKVTFVPLDIKPIARELFSGADMILMMSATITNHKEFAKSLGIGEGEYEYIEIPSTFDAKKSPIKSSRRYSLSFKTNNKDLPKIVEAAISLCEKHKGEKGIIHTHTNQITEAFRRKAAGNPRFLFREIGIPNESIIEQHRERDDDTILVSPSLDTGISLDDDLGRFQIIIKAPFLPLSSKRIKKLYDKNKTYYTMKMLDNIIQMCGRCTRSKDDYSTTYILDGVVVNTILENKRFLPKHFLDRLV